MTSLLVCLLLAPGTVRVSVQGGEASVFALRDGVVVASARTSKGVALLDGIEGRVDLYAAGDAGVSEVVFGVRSSVADKTAGFDAVLKLGPAFPVTIRTEQGARLHIGGRTHDPGVVVLPAGMHRMVIDHPRRVSSASMLLRVAGPLEVEVPLDSGLVVLGQVVGPRGKPVAGAEIEAFCDGYPTGRRAVSGEDGSFGVSGLAGEVVSVVVRAAGFADRLERVLFFPGEERARVRVVLEAGSRVALASTVTATGVLLAQWYAQALEEPRLRAHHVPPESSGTALRFSGLVPGGRYRILVKATGYAPTATAEFVAPGAGKTLDLPPVSLEGGAVLFGRIASGKAGVVVACRGPEGLSISRTDRAGRFELVGLDAGPHLVYLRDVDEKTRTFKIVAGERRQVVLKDAAVDGTRALSGLVLDADGKPLSHVEVRAAGLVDRSDESGRFVLRGLPRGRGSFDVAFRPGFGCRALAKDPHLPHTERRVRVGAKLRVLLPAAGTLTLDLDSGDYPLTRATLYLRSQGGRSIRHRLPRRAKRVVLRDFAIGSYIADVAAPGFLGTGGQVVAVWRGKSEPIRLRVRRGRKVTGRVVLRRIVPRDNAEPLVADKPVSRAWVTLLDADPARSMATTPVDEDGSFVLEGLPRGAIVLCVGAPGLPARAVAVDLSAKDGRDVVLALQEGVEAAILVTGDKDRPIPGARVRILDMIRPDFGLDVRDVAAVGRFLRIVAGQPDTGEIRRTFVLLRQESGRISARFLAPGSYRFLISAQGYKPAKVGVRARTEWQKEQIRRTLEGVAEVRDLTPRVPLARARGARD